MRARDLATPYPSVAPDTPAEEAARLLAEEAVEGVFVQDEHGNLQGVVADTTLLAFLLPRYLAEDRALVGVLGEDVADALWQRLRGRTVRARRRATLVRRSGDQSVVANPTGGGAVKRIRAAMVRTHGSTSYWTSISFAASSAMWIVSAATAATACPL